MFCGKPLANVVTPGNLPTIQSPLCHPAGDELRSLWAARTRAEVEHMGLIDGSGSWFVSYRLQTRGKGSGQLLAPTGPPEASLDMCTFASIPRPQANRR